jgi:hypothetical protein
MSQVELLEAVILKLEGLQRFESLLRSHIPAKYLSGNYLEADLKELKQKLSEVELATLNLLWNCTTLPENPLDMQDD